MENRFENVFTANEEILRTVYSRVSFKRRMLFAAVFFVLLIWNGLLFLIYPKLLTGCSTLFSVGYLIWCFIEPTVQAKRTMKDTLQYHDGETYPYYISVNDEKIEYHYKDKYFSVPLRKIDKILFAKDCILLQSGKSAQVVLLETGFTKGTKEELIEFLRAKCPNLKLPTWKWEQHP